MYMTGNSLKEHSGVSPSDNFLYNPAVPEWQHYHMQTFGVQVLKSSKLFHTNLIQL